MTKRGLLWVITVALLMMSVTTGWAKPAPSPNVPAKAGQVTALLPVAKIVRGAGKAATTTDAKKGAELVWNDLIKTEKGGRARITLTDQSILSLGSQAELRIVKHDARTQQTALQMAYGRVRAQVANITRDGGSFELRTPTAVAGVIGTDFGVDSSPGNGDTFVCIAGAVQISNSDPNVAGSVQCSAGQTTTVMPGKAPTTPVPASLQQLQQFIEDTEPAIISSIAPAAAMPGTNFDAIIAGTQLGKVSGVSIAGGSGVNVSLKSASDTSVTVHITIDQGASAGPRIITLAKDESGVASATVFTVLGTPIGDPKKAYLELLEQLRTTGVGGLGAFLTGAQQAADQVAQQITSANQNLPKPLDLSPFATSLNQQYSVLSNDLKSGSGNIDKAAQQAANTFASLYDAAFQALLARDPSGNPDSTFTTALTGAFTQANTILQTALQQTQTNLNGSVQVYGNQLNTIQQLWSQNINSAFQDQQAGPLPKVNALDRTVELGDVAQFDASSSSASSTGASVTSYQWTLCSANYQPQGFGQMLPANAAACNGIQGFVSTTPEFEIATCSLQPGNYYARLAVTDSTNKISQMDVRLSVLAPNYPTPGGTVRELANAYTSLQLSQFLRWFDAAQFSGYTPLSENIRQTMQSLSSMAINLRLSQENVTCNDATVRADWQQNYSFIGDPSVYSQTEQLSVRLQRTPGKGWFINDFQGDNGKVQGVPGPQTTDTAAPDLEIAGTTIDGRPVSVGTPLAVAAGPHTVAVNVTNNGSAPLALGVLLPVVINVQDSNGSTINTIDTFTGNVPTPLNAGSSVSVSATLNFPTSATNLGMQVQINPSCNPPEKTCGAPNNASYPLALGLPDFNAVFIPTSTVNGIVGRTFSLQAVNVTPSPYPAPLTVAYSGLPAGLAAASPAGNTTNISGSLIVGTPTGTGTNNVTGTASAAGTTKNVTGSATISIGPEISVTAQSAPSFITGGAAQNLVLNVAGGVYPVTVSLALPTGFTTTSGTVSNGSVIQVLNAPGTLTFSLTATNTSATGNQNFTVLATDPGIAASNTPAGNKTFNFPYSVTGLPDLQVGNVQIPAALQMGATVAAQVPVVNNGNAAAASGWSVVVTINGVQAGTASGPSIAAGGTQNVAVSLTIPQVGSAPVSTVVPASIVLNGNNAIQESNTTNNTFNANITLADFTLSLLTNSATAVVGRTFNLPAVDVRPTPYPIQTPISYAGLPAGISAPSVVGANGLLGATLVGTPTGAGVSTITASGNSDGVVHAAGGSLTLDVLNEITVTQVSAINLVAGGVSQNLVLNVAGGVYPVTIALTLPTGITTTSGTVTGNIATQTIQNAQSVTFVLTATSTATIGASNFNVLATDGGVVASGVPAGNVAVQLPYTVTGLADLQVGTLGFPVNGQMGDQVNINIPVVNNGTAAAGAGWNIVVTINGTQVVSTTATPSVSTGGQPVNVPVTITMPTVGAAGTSSTVPVVVTVNSNNAVQETNANNNTANTNITLWDFLLNPVTATAQGIAGRSMNLLAVDVVPTPYPLAVAVSYSGLPTGVSASTTPNSNGLTGDRVIGTPTATGASSVTFQGTVGTKTNAGSSGLRVSIGSEISITQTAPITLATGGAAQNLVLNVSGGVYPLTVALTLPTGITTTSGTISGGISTQVLAAPGSVTYSLTATNTATVGAGNLTVVGTDGGIPASGVPAGNVAVSLPYTVTGLADLQVNAFAATAGQQGATYTENVSVTNVGNAAAASGWNVRVLLNTAVVGSTVGPTIAAGQTLTIPVTVTIPNFTIAPVDQNVAGTVDVNTNQAIPESSTANNTTAYNQRVVDFTITSTPPSSTVGVVGRAYAANQVVSLGVGTPNPYPTTLTVGYPQLPAGLSGTGSGGGLSLPNVTGTPTTAGTVNLTPTATADGITRSAATQMSITINAEIALTQTATPSLTSGGPAQNLSVSVTGGIYPVALALTLPTGITTTSGTVNAGISTITLTGPGVATWALSADFTAASGGLQTNVVATDGGNALTNTPAGNVVLAANYSVNGSASYSVTGYTVTGHTQPFTGVNAFQVGEATQFQISVKNNGNTSPTGNVTVTLDCGNSNVCPPPLPTMSVAAPAAGATATITVPVDFTGFPVASYNGSITLTTNTGGAITGSPVALPFDVVDFTITSASVTPKQNLPINGSAELDVTVTAQPSGTPLSVSVTAAPTDPALTFPVSTKVGTGALGFPLTIGSAAISGAGTVRFNATNHGVTKFVDVPYVAFTASFTSTTLFVNDFSNPLQVPVAVAATAPASYPTVGLKLNGNFDTTNGQAAITVQQPGCGNFSATLFPSTAVPSDIVDLPIYASSGNICPAGTQVILNAAIPQTFPPTSIPVYVLFVTPSGLPQLAVQSATPSRDLTSQPWLSGEPIDWTVVVQNAGSGPSAGNEKVTIYANSAEIGQATLPSAIPAGQTANLIVHAVAPDYPESQAVSSFINVRVSVQNDTQGDLNPGNGDLNQSVNFANWGIGIVNSTTGTSNQTPVNLSPTTTSASVEVGVKNPATFYSGLSLSMVAGSYSSGQLSAPGFSPGTITGSTTSFVNVSFPAATQPLNGYYFVQVIAQMKDGSNVTAQRQATIFVQMNSQPQSPAGLTLSSDRSNIGPSGCTAPTCQTVQINGPLPEAFTLTASVNSCSAGNGCPGTADISFTDSFMTVTTPQVSTVQVTSPGNTLPVRVRAADNPDGSINTGAAKVNVSITAIQSSFFGGARTPTPDPVGSYLFDMNFNVADLDVTSSSCVHVAPQNPTATQLFINWTPINGFNVSSVSWEWQDANHVPVGTSPLAFDTASGTSTYTGNGYTALPTFNVTNPTTGVDGLQTYYFAFTVSNGIATATKYFPFDFDLSRSQTFCPILGASRGAAAGTLIRGSWGKAGLSAPNVATVSSARTASATNGKLPDLRINANDISFTPSIPKQGDTVAVRFRISNVGDGDAVGVPVALQVRGTTVVSDTFDIPAGKTVMGGLQWTNAHTVGSAAGTTTDATAKADAVAARRAMRVARLKADNPAENDSAPRSAGSLGVMQAQIVIDPQKTITQKSTLAKAAPLAHFGVRNSNAEIAADAAINEQRVLLEIPEGGCGGLKFAFGAGTCVGTTDVTFTVEDLAKASYKLESFNGIADLGIGNTSTANASYGSQAVGQNGHTYAVQLNGGNVGIVTVTAVRNPEQLSEAAKRLFRQGKAIRIVKTLGGTTEAPETGDTARGGLQPMVYFEIVYQGQ